MIRHEKPPTEITMQQLQDPEIWDLLKSQVRGPDREAYDRIRDQPNAHPDDLGDLPGISVKSAYKPGQGWSYTGVLAKMQTEGVQTGLVDAEVIVLDNDKETLWHGSREAYSTMWCVD